MARIYQVLKRKDDRFDMTVSSDDEGWTHAIGYCAGWRELFKAECDRIHIPWEVARKDQDKKRPFQSKFHKEGHGTAEEAHECYNNYILDILTEFDVIDNDGKLKCKVCSDWTQNRVMFRGSGVFKPPVPLCSKHNTREHVKRIFDETELRLIGDGQPKDDPADPA